MYPAKAALILILVLTGAMGCAHPGISSDPSYTGADYIFENVNVVRLNEEIVILDQAVVVRDGAMPR